jgi:hypothetical protein
VRANTVETQNISPVVPAKLIMAWVLGLIVIFIGSALLFEVGWKIWLGSGCLTFGLAISLEASRKAKSVLNGTENHLADRDNPKSASLRETGGQP